MSIDKACLGQNERKLGMCQQRAILKGEFNDACSQNLPEPFAGNQRGHGNRISNSSKQKLKFLHILYVTTNKGQDFSSGSLCSNVRGQLTKGLTEAMCMFTGIQRRLGWPSSV